MSTAAVVSGSATSYGVKIAVTITGGGGTVNLTQATLIAALPPGPLKTLFSTTVAAAWTALLNANPRTLVSVMDEGASASPISVVPINLPPFVLQFGSAANATGTVMIRFVHTINR